MNMGQTVKRAEMSVIFLGKLTDKSERSTKNRMPKFRKCNLLSEESNTDIVVTWSIFRSESCFIFNCEILALSFPKAL